MRTSIIQLTALVVMLALTASGFTSCTKCSNKSAAPNSAGGSGSGSSQDFAELKIETLKPGDGAEAALGKKVTVHYKGTFTDGRPFDSSEGRAPFSFTLGQGQVISGWEKGVEGMKVGERRRLSIPSNMAYGERGAGGVIPPNTPLVFEVELLTVE